jgi:polyisoprenoid-binding protein YceI
MSTFTRSMPPRLSIARLATARMAIIAALACTLGLAIAATQWLMQPKESKLTFVGTQAGAEFEGVFEKFTADIKFDPKDLATSRFDVKIDVASVNTQDGERDDTMKGADLFNVKRWPTSQYVADKFTDLGGGKFSATGKLTLRDVTRDVPIEFTFEDKNGSAWLKGSAKLKRIDFGVGQGEWKDTSTVANDVKIKFALLLKKG